MPNGLSMGCRQQLGRIELGVWACELDDVVGADGDGLAALSEEPLGGGDGALFADGVECFAGLHEASCVVGDGERVAVVCVAEP